MSNEICRTLILTNTKRESINSIFSIYSPRESPGMLMTNYADI